MFINTALDWHTKRLDSKNLSTVNAFTWFTEDSYSFTTRVFNVKACTAKCFIKR